MDTLIGLFAGSGSGALLGTVGSIVSGVFKMMNAKNELKAKALEHQQELALQELQLKAQKEETERELAVMQEETSREGLTASMDLAMIADKKAPAWVAVIKSLFRPFLTVALIVMTAWILHLLTNGDLADYVGEDDTADLLRYVIESVVFTASTAIAWWFGDRAMAPRKEK